MPNSSSALCADQCKHQRRRITVVSMFQGGTVVSMMYNNIGFLETGSKVNRTFTCNRNSKWIDSTTNLTISNISCVMTAVATTTPLTLSTIRDLPSTEEANQPTKDSSKPVTERKTTPDVVPPEEVTTASGLSTTDAEMMTTVRDMPSTEDVIVTEEENPTTTTLPAICNNCPALEPLAMTKAGTYNGMLVLWHYRQNGCYRVSISCQATLSETDQVTLYYNPIGKVMEGVGEQAMDLVCNNGKYLYNGQPIGTVSCLAASK